jgi:hypothetical protein
LYKTQPVTCPLAFNEADTYEALLEWYRDECAEGGKVAIACSNRNDDAAIGAVSRLTAAQQLLKNQSEEVDRVDERLRGL